MKKGTTRVSEMNQLPPFREMVSFTKTPLWKPGTAFKGDAEDKAERVAEEISLQRDEDEWRDKKAADTMEDARENAVRTHMQDKQEKAVDAAMEGEARRDAALDYLEEGDQEMAAPIDYSKHPEAGLDEQYYFDHPEDPEAQAYLRGIGVLKSIPSFREMMGQPIAKKVRTVGPEQELDDQFELYLNMYPEKRKGIEDEASLIGGPMAMRTARENAKWRWIEANRKAEMDAKSSSYGTGNPGPSYNQGVESGKGPYGAGIRPDGSYI